MRNGTWGCKTKHTSFVCFCSVTFVYFVPHAYVAYDRCVVASRSVRCVRRTRQCLPTPWGYLDRASLCFCTRTCLQCRVRYTSMKFVRIAPSYVGILWDVCSAPPVCHSMTVLGCLISRWVVQWLCYSTEVCVMSLGAMEYLHYIFVMSSCARDVSRVCLATWAVCHMIAQRIFVYCQNCLPWTGNIDLRCIKTC